jgi:serine/threonine protein kinase
VEYFLVQEQMTPGDLRKKHTIGKATWDKIMNDQEVSLETAVTIQKAINSPDLFSILHDSKLAEFSGMLPFGPRGKVLVDWELGDPLSGELKASNGIKYTLWKLQHCTEKNRFARGKRYDISALPTKEFAVLREFLTRHGEICNRLKGNPRFPRHFTTVPTSNSKIWWIVDEWIPGRTLKAMLDDKVLPSYLMPRIMREIAEGLKALHDADIIRRELSPKFIMLRQPENSVILHDFELGKLLDGSPTVRTKMPPDEYRAPEAGGALDGDDKNIDLYSWGRIFVHVVTGREPPPPDDEEQELAKIKLPKKVHDVVLRCVSLQAENRPQTVDEVLKALRTWK